MYISYDIYALRNDLWIYSPKELQSIFIEILIPSKPSSILSIIYKHPLMKPYKFINKFHESLLSKIKAEGKTTLATDFNVNLIKYNQNNGTVEFLEHIFSNNFTLHITLPMRSNLTSQTLINNIFNNRSVSENLTTTISDHLPQFILLENFKKLWYYQQSQIHSQKFLKPWRKMIRWRIKKHSLASSYRK